VEQRSRVNTSPSTSENYKWIALSNTTLGVLLAFLNSSSLILALPVIFRGIRINPLATGSFSYLLWLLLGYMLVLAVLVVTFGRLGDMFGRTRMYNLGFANLHLGLSPVRRHLEHRAHWGA